MNISMVLPLFRGAWTHGVEVGISSLLINFCGLVMPVFSMLVYDKVVGNGNKETLWALTLGMLLVLLLEFVLRLLRSYAVERIVTASELRVEARIFDHLLAANPRATASPGVLMSRYRDHASAREALFFQYAVIAADLPFLLLFLVALIVLGGWLAAIPVLIVLPMFAGQWFCNGIQRSYGTRVQAVSARKTSLIAELVGGLDFFQISPLRHTLLDRWDEQVLQGGELRSRQRFWQVCSQACAAVCIGLASVTLLFAGVYSIEAGTLSVGLLIACSLVQFRVMIQLSSVVSLVFAWRDLNRTQADLDAAAKAMPQADLIASPVPGALMREIAIQHLTFRLESHVAILKDINLTINRGERVAIVGRPGSGKTTLLRCLAGIDLPAEGQVLVEGTRVTSMTAEARSAWLTFKTQEPVLVGPTVNDDLPAAGLGRSERAMELTGLAASLRHGELTRDRPISAGGKSLSGGQRQVIALARALAMDAAIFLLDEPTSGVDAETEALLVNAVDRLTEGKTVVLATHSMALLQKMDRIVVLECGSVVTNRLAHELLIDQSEHLSREDLNLPVLDALPKNSS